MGVNDFEQGIDYKRVLDFLKNYHRAHYSNPYKPGIEESKKQEYLIIKERGHNAVLEMKKIGEKCKEKFNLEYSQPVKYLDASNVKVRDYLWLQLKLHEYSDIPFSISLFVEMNSGNAQYRISLEVKNDNSNKQVMEQYHSHLEIPLAAGMSYVSGSHEWNYLQTLTVSQEEVEEQVKSHEIKKVQPCVLIGNAANKTNEEYDREIMAAIGKLMPFYEHVIGKRSYDNRKVWLLTWNPENWQWDNYKELCVSTKQGKHAVISWTCLSKEPVVGEEVYLMKIGKQPRGIIAHGIISRESYEAPHYDPAKAAEGKTANHVDVEFDWIQDYENEKILLQDELKKQIGDQEWSPQSSGISIKTGALKLSEMWKKLLEGSEAASRDSKFDKNMILYGPPGTGKTYHTAIYAVAICDDKSIEEVEAEEFTDVIKRYNELKKEGRIIFTTFHQSYGYEDFIEGIKPKLDENEAELSYTIEPGVFKRFCDNVRVKNIATNEVPDVSNARVWLVLLDGTGESDLKKQCFSEGTIRIGWDGFPKTITNDTQNLTDKAKRVLLNFQEAMSIGDIVVAERSNKTIDGIGVITGDYEYEDNHPWPRKRSVKWLMTGQEIDITDLNGGIKLDRKPVYLLYRISPGSIIALVDSNNKVATTQSRRPCVFVIDEINRGNISKIFGELITLIEDTKREGMLEAASAYLPYSGSLFSIPDNVYILGTMNTADRSLALMDTALRRRFRFKEMMPDVKVLRKLKADKVEGLDVTAMLEKINDRITYLYDREHTIGHSFFLGLAKDPTVENLARIFSDSIIPLLQEYFYEDYQKIQLVLGDNGKKDDALKFIQECPVDEKKLFKGNVDDVVDIAPMKYEINKDALKNIESYKEII